MTGRFRDLTERDLHELAQALRSGRLSPPYSAFALSRVLPGAGASAVAADLDALAEQGFGPEQVGVTLEMLRSERQDRPRLADVIELVTTGSDVAGIANRDTSVVVRELFANARASVLLAGYAVYQGQRVFQALADRMREQPALRVRLFLDIQRDRGDTTATGALVQTFSERFRHHQWPGERPLPEVYFDPRSLELGPRQRACLHAKCVVVDRTDVFVSSANFTEAAQERNLEIGLLIRAPELADRITAYFDALLSEQRLTRAF